MSLTDDQQFAFDEIIEFIKDDKYDFFTLKGNAGTGKTFLTKRISDWCIENNIKIVGMAPTHKAKRVLSNFLNKDSFMPIPCITVAKFLTKQRQHSYTGTKNFKGGDAKDASSYDLFIIDECSMISDNDVSKIVENIKRFKKKGLFIGDPCQIPNPCQAYQKNKDGTISKKDSSSFDFDYVRLSKIVRQAEDNGMIQISKLFRKRICEEKDIPRKNVKGVKFYEDPEDFYDKIAQKLTLDTMMDTRIITYTNSSVRAYNKFVRENLGFKEKFVVGELLMGYQNIGWPTPIIENGEEYIVRNIREVDKYIDEFCCRGYQVYLEICSTGGHVDVFFPHLTGKGNVKMLQKLKQLAGIVNQKGSTKEDFKKYRNLKDQVLFLENIYEFEGVIVSEESLKHKHTKLIRHVNNYIDNKTREIINTKDKINDIYPGILTQRIDDNKGISENERLVDKFLVIDMDICYGYAITCHKCQGSTYKFVFIDEKNFEKLTDCWNDKYQAYINGTKEKNQLKYVAYTRASEKAYVLY